MILLDTNVLSEPTRQTPSPDVLVFLQSLPQAAISVLSIHELHYGICRLPHGLRRDALASSFGQMIVGFRDTILPIGEPEARRAAELRAAAQTQGRTLHLADALIGATALEHGLTLATRNVADFAGLGVPLVNPWQV